MLDIDPHAKDEALLISQCQHGDTDAYQHIYKKHVGKIYALCLRLCNNETLAEDLTQETFIKAWQKLSQFKGHSRFGTWLYRLCSNHVISHLRQQKSWLAANQPDEQLRSEALAEASKASAAEEATLDIEHAVTQLPEQARAVLIMYEILGYKHTEIAEITGLAVGTCKAHLHRARKLLQEHTL